MRYFWQTIQLIQLQSLIGERLIHFSLFLTNENTVKYALKKIMRLCLYLKYSTICIDVHFDLRHSYLSIELYNLGVFHLYMILIVYLIDKFILCCGTNIGPHAMKTDKCRCLYVPVMRTFCLPVTQQVQRTRINNYKSFIKKMYHSLHGAFDVCLPIQLQLFHS